MFALLNNEESNKSQLKRIYDSIYLSESHEIIHKIRDKVFGKKNNVGQHCILSRETLDELAYKAHIHEGTNVLDLCCGDGSVSLYYCNKFACHMNGIDLSDIGIQYANKHATSLDRATFIQGDITDRYFVAETFDAAFCFDSLLHVTDKPIVLERCFNILKSGGNLVVCDWISKGEYAETVKEKDLWGHIDLYMSERYVSVLQRLGFKIKEVIDHSKTFKNIIYRWHQAYASYKDAIIKSCGEKYYLVGKARWALLLELAKKNIIGQYSYICEKEYRYDDEKRTTEENISDN